MKQIIYYVNALASAGKTHQAIPYAINRARLGEKVVIAQPSRQLISESHRKAMAANSADVKITRIDSTVNPSKALATLVKHLKHGDPSEGEVLFITHAALFACPYWHEAGNWTLIIDEVPEPVIDLSLRVKRRFGLLTTHLQPRSFNIAYDVVLPSNQGAAELKVMADNRARDQVDGVFSEVCKKLFDRDWTVYCNTTNYKRIISGKGDDDAEHKNLLVLYGQMHPSILAKFKTVTIMGAMFTERSLYALWSNEGVDFKEHKALSKSLRFSVHDGSNVQIEYLTDYSWSKTYMNKSFPDGTSPFDHLIQYVAGRFPDKPYLYILNNAIEDVTALSLLPGGTRVPVVCHGLNVYDKFDNIAFMPALNPSPSYFSFMETLGINGDEIRRNHYLQSLYQGVMRCSLRDLKNKNPKVVVVPCKDGAEYLHSYLQGSTVKKVGNLPGKPINAGAGLQSGAGRPKLWRDDKARYAAKRAKDRVLAELEELYGKSGNRCISIVPSIYSPEVINHDVTSNQALMLELRQAINTAISSKKDNILISPAQFKSDKSSDTKRGLDNIESIYGVWLDNDGGDLHHDEFHTIFSKLWLACFSTYSGGNRYRVFIPTSGPMTIEADAAIKKMIFAELARAGFHAKGQGGKKVHGFDVSKITPSSLFYIPCKTKDSSESFFVEYDGEELNPTDWIRTPTLAGLFDPKVYAPVPKAKAVVAPCGDKKLQAIRDKLNSQEAATIETRIEAARRTYFSVPSGSGMRNNAFFKFGSSLQKMGLTLADVEQQLKAAADDSDRRKQIPSIISTLKKKAV
jgi:hypothetical protein